MMLATYISHIFNHDDCCTLLSDIEQHDALSEVTKSTKTWAFNDGVILKCIEEKETEYYSNDAQCPECWITWEVMESANKQIVPMRKEFFNLCQQSFWLKMQLANLAN